MIWSLGNEDPPSETGLAQHSRQGRVSINLLGGLNEDPVEPDSTGEYFDVKNEKVLLMDSPYLLGTSKKTSS